jgi:GAF domain-containing protein
MRLFCVFSVGTIPCGRPITVGDVVEKATTRDCPYVLEQPLFYSEKTNMARSLAISLISICLELTVIK